MSKKLSFSIRQLLTDIHLWLGIASGIVLFIVCLTGTIYTFKTEIEEFIEPHKYKIETADTQLEIADVITRIEAETEGKVSRLVISDKASRPYEVNVKMDAEDKRGSNFMFNQYTGEMLGNTKGPASEFFLTVFKLHRWLLMDMEVGRPIVGIATLIFVVLAFTGFIIWFPKKINGWKSFKPGLKIMWKARFKRLNHDLHSTLGFYSLIIILVMSLTGLTWSFEWYKNGFHQFLTGKAPQARGGQKDHQEPKEAITPSITYEEALAIAHHALPYTGKTIISKFTPKSDKFEVIKFNSSRLNVEASDKIEIDPVLGNVINTELFDDLRLGEKISKQYKGLHMGTTYGIYSKIIYFIVCLICTTLPITGILIWYHKLRKF